MSDQSVDLMTYLAELEQEREALDRHIAAIRRRLELEPEVQIGGASTPTGTISQTNRDTPTSGRIRADEFFGMSIPEAIKAYLAIVKQPQGPKAIVDGLTGGGLLTNAKYFYANVTTALKRLRTSGQVMLTPNGWGLAVWYPNRARAATPATKKGRGKRRIRAKATARRAAPVEAPRPEKSLEVKAPAAHSNGGSPKGANDYRAFMSEQRKAGKSMADVAAEWQARKKAASN